MNTQTLSLLERVLKALEESRDDVATSIHLLPDYKIDIAAATAQLTEHKACIDLVAAAIAAEHSKEQAKPQLSLDMRILAITTAYEQGFGKGQKKTILECPYTKGEWLGCDIAWQLGYAEGMDKPNAPTAKPQQEPVAWLYEGSDTDIAHVVLESDIDEGQKPHCVPLYTSPQPLKPLSDEDIDEVYLTLSEKTNHSYGRKDVARAIEAKLGVGK